MTHLYMLCACIFCWIVGYVDSVGYPVYGEVTAPPLWNALCLVYSAGGIRVTSYELQVLCGVIAQPLVTCSS